MDAKKKKNLEETYERILNVGFCIVPYEDISDIIGPDPMVYGTAKDERILSFEGVEALFKSQYEQMGNMKPAYERKRIALRISNGGNNACIIEELTFTLSSEEEIHTIFMRATCVMEYLDNQWKLTHWHTSTPVDTENDPWHMEEWKREKEKLQRLVDQQTAALKQNNRELQIEAALEKIRSSSLAMQKTDDLRDVVKVLFEQMQGLSVDMGFASVSIFIFEDGSRNIRQWLPLPDGVSSLSVPYFDHPISSDLFDAKESGEDFFTKIYTLEEKNTWLAHGFEHTDYKDLPVTFKSSLLQAPGYAIAITLAKNSGICIPSFEGRLPTPEDIRIMKRVGKVFEQAYIRFLDLQKAEAQAREAQIEVVLERIRSRSLAMHRSEELVDLATDFYKELRNLDVQEFSDASIVIFDADKNQQTVWGARTEADYLEKSIFPLLGDQVLQRIYDLWNQKEAFFTVKVGGSALKKHIEFVYPLAGRTELEAKVIGSMPDPTYFHCAYFSFGYLELVADKELSEGSSIILTRFAKVFEQAYTRFLDLQKAEAQAREARIEAALERVRSRSLAMHHSSELSTVVDTLLREFTNLEFTLTFCIINLIDEKDMSNIVWAANPETGKDPESYYMKFEDYPFHHAMWDAWKAQKKRFVYTIEGEEKKIYDEYLYNDTEFRRFPKNVQEANKALERYVAGFTFFKYSGLQTVSVNPISEDELEILERFGRVFEQAYTRFLDLQKAEAQAREAQIEAALERVRSASMAMHKTDELAKVVEMLFLQFSELDLDFYQVWINIFRLEEGVSDCWFSPVKGVINEAYTAIVPLEPFENLSIKSWKAGEEFSYLSWNGLREVDKVMKELSALTNHPSFHQVQKKKRMKRVEIVDCNHKYGVIAMAKNEDITDNDRSILKRFANVFEQSYTRFLDLQKAEAQAREARIETALERVRSKSLAMHDSRDLHEVVTIVFEQLESIGLFMNSVLLHELVYDSKSQHFWVAANGQVYPEQTEIPITKNAFFSRFEEARRNGESFFTQTLSKRQKDAFFEHYFKQSNHSDVPQKRKDYIYSCESLNRSTALNKYTALSVSRYDKIAYTKEENKVIKRFSQVFEQSYQRYLDLKKAEDQAKEAQIVASMERVRAATMAMHQSDELSLVLSKLFEQFDVLGIKPSHAVLTLIDKERNTMNFRTTGKNGYQVLGEQEVDLSLMNAWVDTAEKWKKSDPNAVNVNEYPPEILPEVWEVYKDILATMPQKARPEIKDFPEGLFITEGYCKFGYIGFAHYRKPTEEEKDIVRRIAAEFGTLYQRFLDLKKSEAQAKEAKIEVALEKVRSRTMGMQSSEELPEVANMMFLEVQALGISAWSCGYCILLEDRRSSTCIMSSEGTLQKPFLLPHYGEVSFEEWDKFVHGEESFFVQELGGNAIESHYNFMKSLPQLTPIFQDIMDAGFSLPTYQINHLCKFSHGFLLFITYEKVPASHEIFKRFTKVFDQTYTRFLDLQKAESQAKEAQIEAALERVRSRTMGMQKAEELGEVATVLFREMNGLVDNLWTCGFVLCEPNRQEDEWWLSLNNGLIQPFFLPNIGDYAHESLYEGWKKGESYRTVTLQDEVLQEHYDWLMNIPISRKIFEEMEGSGIPRPNWQRLHAAYFKTGYLVIITEVPCEAEEIFKRFAQVFDLTYTRFLDLQKAENQARESQIEASLERVRAKALAMHNSEDLRQTITAIFEELKGLNIKTIRLGLGLVNPDSPEGEIITSRIDEKDHIIEVSGKFRLEGHPVLDSVYNHFKQQKDHFPVLMGEEINSYYKALQGYVNVQGQGTDTKHFGCFLYFKEGCLYAWSAEPHSEGQIGILKKFSRVVEITYRRYKDLLESEYREKEAVKQASLDRVRAEIASMRTAEDLERITPLIWKELTTLGIPFIRCGVFIMDEQEELIHTFLSTPDGKAIAAFHLPYTSNPFFNAIEEWRAKKIHISHWDTEEFSALADSLVKEGQLTNREQYLNSVPKGGLYLHYVPFLQGIVYVGNTAALSNENLSLVQSVADAFSTAYARYEDFVKLEQAKAKVESAMSELKATQSQLVQQEKLASLGQLTAGIAHEIKNPLNFVNNFSEVSLELLDEIKETRNKSQETRPKTEEDEIEEEILEDIKSNLKKIHEHGSRANGIVTSMLQHSRGGSGKKEPTDLNALIKEYVNLSFHGMRAGKNPINVDIKLDLDPEIKEVSLIKEDFTRVVINLCNNAFDAMREKVLKTQDARHKIQDSGIKTVTIGEGLDSNQKGNGKYQPCLKVSTKIENMKVRISLEDNGPGIPDEIKDKILQPFFTTKKGTEGTGLGLSITHDIIKAHGGELKVESLKAENQGYNGQGSRFTISLLQS